MRKPLIFTAVFICVLTAPAGPFGFPASAAARTAEPAASITTLAGTEANLNGVRMVPGATLFPGDAIRLGAASSAALRFGNSLVLAAPQTELIVESKGLILRGGQVQVRAQGNAGFTVIATYFQVNLPAGAVSSNSAEVRLEGAHARISAVAGTADLTAAGNAAHYRLHAGEAASLEAPEAAPAPQNTAGSSAGQVSRMIPQVQIDHAAQSHVATTLDPVFWNDDLRSGPTGRAHIALNDGSQLNLGSNTSMVVLQHDAQGQQTSLDLAIGRLRGIIAPLTKPGAKFEIRTPVGVAGLVGTDFSLEVTNDYVELIVFEGAVQFTISANGQTILVPMGNKLRIQRTGVAIGPLPASPAEIQTAQNLTDIPATVPPGGTLAITHVPVGVWVAAGTAGAATVGVGTWLATQEHKPMSPTTLRK